MPTAEQKWHLEGNWFSQGDSPIMIEKEKDQKNYSVKILWGGHDIEWRNVELFCDKKLACEFVKNLTKQKTGLIIKKINEKSFKILKSPSEILKGEKKPIQLLNKNSVYTLLED